MPLSGTYQAPDEIISGLPVPTTSLNKYGNSILYLYNNLPVSLLTTRGDLLTRDATGLVRLGIGATGRYLRSNGTDPSWSTLAASDLTYSGLTAGQYLRASGATAAAFAALQFADLTFSGLTAGQYIRASGASAAVFSALQFADLTYSGLTAGNVLRATGATTAAFGALQATDLPAATVSTQGAVLGGVNCRVYNSGNISVVTGGSGTALTFDSERWDTDGMHSTSSNTGRITATRAGQYIITAHVRFAANGTGARSLLIRLNGTTFIANAFYPAVAGGDNTDVSVATLYQLAASDYVEVVAYQSSGGALNALASGNFSPEFAIARIA